MIPKEKAEQLVYEMYHVDVVNLSEYGMEWNMAKQCALIAIDYIIYNINPIEITQLITSFKSAKDFDDNLVFMDNYITKNLINEKLYWQEVKNELEKL